MSTQTLGSLSFLDTPDVNGNLVLTSATGLSSGALVAGSNIVIGGTGLAPTISLADNPVFTGTSGAVIPSGTTAQRPSTPAVGTIRVNTTLNVPEAFAFGTWILLGRTIQTVTGNIGTTTGTFVKTSGTTAPLSTDAAVTMWSTTFTPEVVGSTILCQFSVTVSHAVAGRQIYIAVFANTTCIGMATAWIATAGTMVSIPFQCAYTTPALTTITFKAVGGTFGTTATTSPGSGGSGGAASGAIFINQNSGTNTFASALQTEYRLTELM